MKKMKVAYLRVSSDEQKEKHTIESQRAELLQYCKARAVNLDKIYADDGVSGTIPLGKRPSGSDLLANAAAGLIEEIYVWKFDRLGRDLRAFLNLQHGLDRYGVHVESITQPVPKGPAGRMMMQMLGAFAEMDRENILENTRRGLKQKAESGGWTGGPVPFGYRVDGEKRTARLVLDELALPNLTVSRAALVQELFARAAAGESSQILADYLNQLGVPTSRQNPESLWRPSSVRVILTNPSYTGTRYWGRRHWVKVEEEDGETTSHLKMRSEPVAKSACPAIVSQDLWDRANAALKTNQIVAMAHAKNEYLLRGLIFCGTCGKRFVGRGYCYSCIGRHCARRLNGKNAKRCAAPLVYRREWEDAVWELCEGYVRDPGKLALEAAAQAASNPVEKLFARKRELETILARKATRLRRAHILFVDEKYDRAEYDRDVLRINATFEPAERELEVIEQKLRGSEERARDLSDARAFLDHLHESAASGYAFAEKRQIVQLLVNRVTVRPNGACHIDLRFHCGGVSSWLRGLIEERYHGVPRKAETDEQARAGAAALAVAARYRFEATPGRCGFTSCTSRGSGMRRQR